MTDCISLFYFKKLKILMQQQLHEDKGKRKKKQVKNQETTARPRKSECELSE